MSIDFNEITPQDRYIIKTKEPIELNKISNLIDLYQPIIGVDSVSFYITLVNHVSLGKSGVSDLKIHRQLMSQMGISFKSIIQARKVLEAIGLLKTFKYSNIDEEGQYLVEYFIISPLDPLKFFQSDVLSVLLLNRIGKSQYKQLKEKLIPNLKWENDSYNKGREITKSFDDIFDTFELKITEDSEELLQPVPENIEQIDNQLRIKKKYLDMSFIKGMVNDIFQLHSSLDVRLEELLNELAFLYHLSEVEIINILKDHTIYDNTGKINNELLKQRAREKYHFEQNKVIIVNKEKESSKGKLEDTTALDKAKKHKWILSNYSPIELLEKYQKGGKIPDSDLVLIEELLYNYKLPSDVVNVLIEYVMLTNDYKLPRKLTEKIAGHWKRLSISTVEEALAVAKKEHKLYKDWKTGNKGKKEVKTSRNSGQAKKEKIPEYILMQEEKYHNKDEKNQDIDESSKDEINQLLKELGEV